MDRTRVLMLFGGESSEHDVSISSARNVYAAIDEDKFDVVLGYIDTFGKWWLLKSFDHDLSHHGSEQLLPVLGGSSFVTMPESRIVKPDVILPILHGKNGEDGSVQGLAQLLHIPIVGCDMTASAIGMDKLASKKIVAMHGIKVVPYAAHYHADTIPSFNKLSMTLGSPLFVKPSRAGSSVGVSKVHSEDEFVKALEAAHAHDQTALIEQAITARELEVAVLGTPPVHKISGVGEIVPGDEFYSYEDKYANGSSAQVVVPADISDTTKQQIETIADEVYRAVGCTGLARIDFFMDENGEIYFNEINTLPGFTNISMYPKLWKQEGVSYSQLVEMLITDALTSVTINTQE